MIVDPSNLKLIIVIPCLAETGITQTLDSLKLNSGFDFNVECLIVVNHAESASTEIKSLNQNILNKLLQIQQESKGSQIKFIPIEIFNQPDKKAGVGLARKTGMDLAMSHLKKARRFKDGIIVCLDGDCTVQENYIFEIDRYFRENKSNGCSIYFEHPIDGENTNAIIDYELFLRYYTNALRWSGFPYAFQTVGSSMAVSVEAYEKQGGMNVRKAGEDFYFLNKIIQLGSFGDLTSTTVYPSSRKSERVPFGTGREMIEWEQNRRLLAYSPESFLELKNIFSLISRFRECENPIALLYEKKIHPAFISYLTQQDLNEAIAEAKSNTASLQAFHKRFFAWMNAFRIMKLLNELSLSAFQKIPIRDCAAWLWHELSPSMPVGMDAKTLLLHFRKFDRIKT